MLPHNDTIVAIATPRGNGGIGVIRVSGPLSAAVAHAILASCPPPRQASYLAFRQADQTLIDHGIAIFYPAPHSYTGEDVLELQAHGGMVVLSILLDRCLALGARQADPGEFTYRAYCNHKLDLVQAEAVADVINASTASAVSCAMRSLSGEFSQRIHQLVADLTQLRLLVEACLDFPEEELDALDHSRVMQDIQSLKTQLAHILQKAQQGSLLREGLNVVLVGEPNVGKSSLLNCLAEEEIAIVTPIAGTTRDVIRQSIQINGIPFHISDTAGLHATQDHIEQIGMRKTWQMVEQADIVICLSETNEAQDSTPSPIWQQLLSYNIPIIQVHNKIDLYQQAPDMQQQQNSIVIYLSAKHHTGIDLLKTALLKAAGHDGDDEGVFMARTRHLTALKQAHEHICLAQTQVAWFELMAEELANAQDQLGKITGEVSADDLLGKIFSQFCIGK